MPKRSVPKRVIVALPLAVLGAGWALYLALPWPLRVRTHFPERTALMKHRAAQAAARGETFALHYSPVPLDRISSHLRRAVIVAEDGRFYEHRGVDWDALREEFRYRGDADFSWTDRADLAALLASFRYYRQNRDRIRGRSTITQQLAKNLYFGTSKTPIRKLRELVVAQWMEQDLTKARILALYMNVIEWGDGTYGCEAAARLWYGKPAAALTPAEAAGLAAMIPNPRRINPRVAAARHDRATRRVLWLMGQAGYIGRDVAPLEVRELDTDATAAAIAATPLLAQSGEKLAHSKAKHDPRAGFPLDERRALDDERTRVRGLTAAAKHLAVVVEEGAKHASFEPYPEPFVGP